MQLRVPPDLETLINKRLSSGGYTDAEDVLRRALEAQDAEESWTEENDWRCRLISRKAINRPNGAN
jgi:Arc/MetJ-type ribon-helix-helix transcriptional regulator